MGYNVSVHRNIILSTRDAGFGTDTLLQHVGGILTCLPFVATRKVLYQ